MPQAGDQQYHIYVTGRTRCVGPAIRLSGGQANTTGLDSQERRPGAECPRRIKLAHCQQDAGYAQVCSRWCPASGSVQLSAMY